MKNGSERVVDDARSHIFLLRMLRQFHYIDNNGKDQGINVRNRSQELTKLLGDVDAIRAERKKARANRNKFRGMAGGLAAYGGFSGGSGFGGFGSDDAGFGGYSGGVYGDGGGFGGNTSGFNDGGRRSNRFEEYDEADDDGGYSSLRRPEPSSAAKREAAKPTPPKEPEQDLFDFGDDEPSPAPAATTSTKSSTAGKQPASHGLDILSPEPAADDDDFDDFQSAPSTQPTAKPQLTSIPPPTHSATSSTQYAAPKPVSGSQGASLNGLVGLTSMTPTPSASSTVSPVAAQPTGASTASVPLQPQQPKPTGFQAVQPNYFTSVPAPQQPPQSSRNSISSTTPSLGGAKPKSPSGGKAGGDVFGSLWSSASANAGLSSAASAAQQPKGPNLASMAKEKASAGIWGSPSASSTPSMGSMAQRTGNGTQQPSGSNSNDLLG